MNNIDKKRRKDNNNAFLCIPQVCLINICEFLDIPSVGRTIQTCKTLRENLSFCYKNVEGEQNLKNRIVFNNRDASFGCIARLWFSFYCRLLKKQFQKVIFDRNEVEKLT